MPADLLPVGELDRRTYIGSSDIAAILGLSPWKTPGDVFFEKLGQVRPIDPQREKLFKRGKRLEPIVLDMMADELGIEIMARGRRYRSHAHPWMAAEIDGEFIDADDTHTNIEVKTIHPFAADQWGEADTDEIPIHYSAQAMWGMMITGRERCIFGALFGADNLVTYRLERDDETIAGMANKAIAFWREHVQLKVPPDPITLEDVYRLMRRDADIIAEADEDTAKQIRAFEQAKQEARAATDYADDLKFQIGKWALGVDAVAMPSRKPKHVITYAGSPLLTISYQEQNRIDSDAVRNKYPKVAAECSKTSSFFRFDSPRKRRV